MESYRTVCGHGTGEITEKKSRFIADIFPVSSEEEAFEHIERIRKKHWSARHHCFAFVLGRNPGYERISDDGEPSGTAGKPILEVLKGRGLTDVLAVVTRYFGGTLLGTGGLVRAYTAAAAEGISRTGIITKIHGIRLQIGTDYTGLGKIQHLLLARGINILDTVYTDKVELQVLVPKDETDELCKAILESTNGQALMEEGEECWFSAGDSRTEIYHSET
nr:YigZ family protein [uncultured Mediterraneibacter sp.]